MGNSWIPIIVASFTVGIAFIERPKDSQESGTTYKFGPTQASPRVGASSRVLKAEVQKKTDRSVRRRFDMAVRVLRFFVRYLEATSIQKVTETELAHVRQAALKQEREQMRLRRRLSRVFPSLYQTSIVSKHESRAEQFVERTLDLIHQNYGKPISLKQCADQLALHPAYLCRLFSQIVGLPFKMYLTDLRFEKARQLLSDPVRRVSEVAYAVGYNDANQFRAAFKKATGLSPLAWRQAFRSSSPS
jgi:YesN/AraC family two-component response regulator